MPTPMRAFGLVAQLFGKRIDPPIEIDPNNKSQVSHFFESIAPSLPQDTRRAILDELLSREELSTPID
jgi:hypothetical protein